MRAFWRNHLRLLSGQAATLDGRRHVGLVRDSACLHKLPRPTRISPTNMTNRNANEIVNGIGASIDDRQVLSGVLKPNTTMTLKITGSKLTVDAVNTDDAEMLHLEGTVKPDRFGGAGVFWPGGSTDAYSRIDVNYPRN